MNLFNFNRIISDTDFGFDRIHLGENVTSITDPRLNGGCNNNIIVCGGTGSGKTMSVSEPCLLTTNNSSLIVSLTKRKLINRYSQMFRDRDYEVLVMDFVMPQKNEISYDPMFFVKDTTDISFLAKSIIMADQRRIGNKASDPFWDQTACSLLCAEIALAMCKKQRPSFADVLNINDSLNYSSSEDGIITSLDSSFEFINSTPLGRYAYNHWRTFRDNPPRTASCIYTTLRSCLDDIFNPQLRKMMSIKNKLSFKRMANRKTVLFVLSSPVNPSLQTFVNFFYSQAFKSLFEYAEEQPDGKLPIPVRCLCDDFATGSRILNFPEYISVFRAAGISAILLIQSETQLASIYGDNDAATIINNCDTYIYMGGMDIRTCRNISERVNLPLEDVLNLPIGQEIVFRRGQKPVITKRYDICHNMEYEKLMEEAQR